MSKLFLKLLLAAGVLSIAACQNITPSKPETKPAPSKPVVVKPQPKTEAKASVSKKVESNTKKIQLNKSVSAARPSQASPANNLQVDSPKIVDKKPVEQQTTSISKSDEETIPSKTNQEPSRDLSKISTMDLSLLSTPLSGQEQTSVESFCKEWSEKLRTVKYKQCMQLGLRYEQKYTSVKDRILTYKHYLPSENQNTENPSQGRILFISGIHGDEYSAISITYLWMLNMMKHQHQQHWLFLPLSNPDGLFRNPATRINANDVDLNRNFPSPDWNDLAINYWKKHTGKNKRRFPGPGANSEPETQWMVELIEKFKPDAIISVHAPYGLVDYDGPEHAEPGRIGGLKYRELGTYPGSLGRYAGEYLNIPVLTLELRSAGSMPSEKEIYNMWRDVEKWTVTKIKGNRSSKLVKLKPETAKQPLENN